MPQFLIGFWCGCIATALVMNLLFANRKKQSEGRHKEDGESVERENDSGNVPVNGNRIRVLLVDDSRLSRTVMKTFLATRNWEVFEAGSGQECLQLVKKEKYDLIFLDQNMPGLNGDETLQHLQKDGMLDGTVPVIAVGSSVRKEKEGAFREKGYAACLGKPIQENRMAEILSQMFPQCDEEGEPEGFSYEKGLKNFDGNEEAYHETLVLFAELWEERREQLRQFLEEKNMDEYAILIHAVKGDARTLGADMFGELAYEQELKAKQGKVWAIENSFERVIKEGDKTAVFFKRMFS